MNTRSVDAGAEDARAVKTRATVFQKVDTGLAKRE